MRRLLPLVLCSLFLWSACKKSKTVQQKIQATWQVVSVVEVSTVIATGVLTTTNYTILPSDYMEFRADGTVPAKFNNLLSTGSYQLQSESSLTYNNAPYSILVLDNNNFVFKYTSSGTGNPTTSLTRTYTLRK